MMVQLAICIFLGENNISVLQNKGNWTEMWCQAIDILTLKLVTSWDGYW